MNRLTFYLGVIRGDETGRAEPTLCDIAWLIARTDAEDRRADDDFIDFRYGMVCGHDTRTERP
jgi:hypothetical protein